MQMSQSARFWRWLPVMLATITGLAGAMSLQGEAPSFSCSIGSGSVCIEGVVPIDGTNGAESCASVGGTLNQGPCALARGSVGQCRQAMYGRVVIVYLFSPAWTLETARQRCAREGGSFIE